MNLCRIFLIIFCLIVCFFQAFADEIPIATDTRIKTLVYNPNGIYELKMDYKHYLRIEFAKNEGIKNIAIGDNSSWSIMPVDNTIFLRPVEKAAKTNMIVETTKCFYIFDLIAVDSVDTKDLTYLLRFYHPTVQDDFDQKKGGDLLEDNLIKQSLKKKIHYNYALDGHKEIRPESVYDDGELTFFKFTGDVVPKIFVPKVDGAEYAIEMISYKDLIMVKGIYHKLILHYQDKRVEVIRGES